MGNIQTPTITPLHRKSARFGGVLSHPLRFLRWTGCLTYRPISYTAFKPIPMAEPLPFTAPDPGCAVAEMPWTRSKAIDMAMAHTIMVENGVANCLGYVFDEKGRLIDGGTHKHREGRNYQRWIKRVRFIRPHPTFPKMEYYGGTIVILTASTQRFYFHWLFDVLPRLGMLAAIPEEFDLIYIEKKHQFQKETLEIMALDDHQIINSAHVALLTANNLIVPCHQIMNGREFPSWVIRYLRDRFLPLGAKEPAPQARRIYVSRGPSGHRRLRNEEEIIGKLGEYGFVEVRAETLSFQEQVGLFREAKVVAAPHGSGLANIVFCSPGTQVVELFPAANIDLYYRLSTALQLKYHYVKDRTGNPARLTLNDYTIAWDDLKKTLHAAAITPPQ